MDKENTHIGSSFDDFLQERGELVETGAIAIKRVVAWQLAQKMEDEKISKKRMAELLSTSRSSLDRLLDPANTSITLHTLSNAAHALGKTLQIKLV